MSPFLPTSLSGAKQFCGLAACMSCGLCVCWGLCVLGFVCVGGWVCSAYQGGQDGEAAVEFAVWLPIGQREQPPQHPARVLQHVLCLREQRRVGPQGGIQGVPVGRVCVLVCFWARSEGPTLPYGS